MTLSRRPLITGLASLVAAPAIVRASSLMPVKAWCDADLMAALSRVIVVPPASPGSLSSVQLVDLLRAHAALADMQVPDGDRYAYDPQTGTVLGPSNTISCFSQ
jgi:hypothetical protein